MGFQPINLDLEFFEELLFLNYDKEKQRLKRKIIYTIDGLPKNISKESFFEDCHFFIQLFKEEYLKNQRERIQNLNKEIDFAKNNIYGGGSKRINNHKSELKKVRSKSFKYFKTINYLEKTNPPYPASIYISLLEIEEIEELCNTIKKEIILDDDKYSALEIAYYIYYMKEAKEDCLSFPFPSQDGYKELGKRFNKNWKNIQIEYLNISNDRDIRLKKGRARKVKKVMKLLTPKALSIAESDFINIY